MKYREFELEGYRYQNIRLNLFAYLSSFFISEASADEVVLKNIPRLEWEGLPEASSYEVQVSTDKEFKNIIVTNVTKNNLAQLNMKNPGRYYWHVRALDQSGSGGEFSETASFKISKKETSKNLQLAAAVLGHRAKIFWLSLTRTKGLVFMSQGTSLSTDALIASLRDRFSKIKDFRPLVALKSQ